MLATAYYVIPDEQIGLWPVFHIMNRLDPARRDCDHVFMHKRVEYDGKLILTGNSPVLVRICIVQPRMGGEERFAERATATEVFGTPNPTVATALSPNWIGISDRHYMVTPEAPEIRLNYSHRLSHNMSLQMTTLGRWAHVDTGAMWLCAIADINNEVQFHNLALRTVGTVDTVPYIDEEVAAPEVLDD